MQLLLAMCSIRDMGMGMPPQFPSEHDECLCDLKMATHIFVLSFRLHGACWELVISVKLLWLLFTYRKTFLGIGIRYSRKCLRSCWRNWSSRKIRKNKWTWKTVTSLSSCLVTLVPDFSVVLFCI